MAVDSVQTEVESLGIEQALRERLQELGSVAVALSGGIDSSTLAVLARDELGERAVAVTLRSVAFTDDELQDARALAAHLQMRHIIADCDLLGSAEIVANGPRRCYHCKKLLFRRVVDIAGGCNLCAVLDGTTASELSEHRPGLEALRELCVLSPWAELGALKTHVRTIAARLGLPAVQRPSTTCLATRIAFGTPITARRLEMVELAEKALRRLGFADIRVRLHPPVARVEVPAARIPEAAGCAAEISRTLRRIGFVYVTLDLEGLRSGSMLDQVVHELP